MKHDFNCECRTLDLERLRVPFDNDSDVVFAFLFGSSHDGVIRNDSDVDVGVYLRSPRTPLQFLEYYLQVSSRLGWIEELDLVDLRTASSVLAFEALRGRRLCVHDEDCLAEFASYTARMYEDDMAHAGSFRRTIAKETYG